ncbi:hypothetical protein SAMN05920897_10917 [Alkalispirochaeta americana]|uniref:Ion transport domain-containing protein n=1 Tax=Alkalispirochaeta americana TaxID=159291 RepID=A0A1N6SVA2_9SPIO|nr:hypothetical protein [Alkalispirochaeta americana]SIQ45048.1 hypothetical protein SAMN05920897_10917 [Alkalispirochaeta americana]
MNLEARYEEIRKNFEDLEIHQQAQHNISLLEFAFILCSILVMIPYELALTAQPMLVFGTLNLFFDLVFLVLLVRFISWKKEGRLTLFTAVTDSLAALPGMLALIFLVVSLLASLTGSADFVVADFLAAGGLSVGIIRSTKLLRALRLTRLFRLLRNIKMLRFIALKSDSSSCEATVGWLGFFVLAILILLSATTTVWGPLGYIQDSSERARERLQADLEARDPADSSDVLRILGEHSREEDWIYLQRGDRRNYGQNYRDLSESEAETSLSRRYNGLNSYVVSAGDWEILMKKGLQFHAQRRHNVLWVTGIIVSVTLFSMISTSLIGRTYTDYLNDYRKAILDSYKGIESLFEVDPGQLCRNDRDSFAYAIGLYTRDFLTLVRDYRKLSESLDEKDQEIRDLNEVIGGLEADLEPVDADLQACVEVLQKLCRKNPGLAGKINSRRTFRTFSLG